MMWYQVVLISTIIIFGFSAVIGLVSAWLRSDIGEFVPVFLGTALALMAIEFIGFLVIFGVFAVASMT